MSELNKRDKPPKTLPKYISGKAAPLEVKIVNITNFWKTFLANSPILISTIALIWTIITYNVSYDRENKKAIHDQRLITYSKFLNICTSLKYQHRDSSVNNSPTYKKQYSEMVMLRRGELELVGDSAISKAAYHYDKSLQNYHASVSTENDRNNVNIYFNELCNLLKSSLEGSKN